MIKSHLFGWLFLLGRREVEGFDAEEGGTEDEELGDEHVDARVDHPHRGKEETEQSENDGEEEGEAGECLFSPH